MTPSPALATVVPALVATLLGVACARVLPPAMLDDMQTAVRVKTALVNDPIVGVRPIEVSVSNGVARLTGTVASEAEATRAAEISRGVAGVRDVRVELSVRADVVSDTAVNSEDGKAPKAALPSLSEPDDFSERDPTLLAVGVSVRLTQPASAALESSVGIGPLIRLGSGEGLGVSVGFGWFGADLSSGSQPAGHVRVRPVMAGVGYTVKRARVSASASLVAGPAFNSLSSQDRAFGPPWALAVDNSFAWRPGLSIWVDVSRRTAFNVGVGHLITRPRITWLEDGRTEKRTLRGDATMASAGVVYKLF